MDSKRFIDQHWHSLSQLKWRWEFLRRCEAFRKDTARYLDSFGTWDLFVDIWDLPHPGVNCLSKYAYLPGFRVLLTNILACFLIEKSQEKATADILRFARALGGDSFYYDGTHSLVDVRYCGGKMMAGEYVKEEMYFECSIRISPALKKRIPKMVELAKARLPIISAEHVRLGKDGHFRVKLAIAGCHDGARTHEEKLAELTRELLNDGLEPVIPWQRKRKNKLLRYRYQLTILDVLSGRKDGKGLFRVYDNEPGLPKDNFNNHRRLAEAKIRRLEEQANLRRSYLE